MTRFTWNATETESVEPFRTAHHALDSISFRMSPEDEFSEHDTWVVDDEELLTIEPELNVVLDDEALTKGCGIPAEDLIVNLAIRDREFNLFFRAFSWPLNDIPQAPQSLGAQIRSLSSAKRMDVAVCVTPRCDANRGVEIASEAHNVVAAKTFKLRALKKRTRFPKRWATAEEFEQQGLSADTIFWVEWLGEDLDRHPADTFVVWLNEDYKEQIKSFQIGGSSGHLLSIDLSTMILSEIAAAVLASEQDGVDPNGTINIVGELLAEVNGLDIQGMRSRFERHDGFSVVRIWAQAIVGAPAYLGDLNFLGGR